MELEFPEFVLLLMVAVGLLAFGPFSPYTRDRLDRMATTTAASRCIVPEASHFFGDPSPPAACTVY